MDSPYRPELLAAIGAVQRAAQLSQSLISARDKGTISKEDLSPVTIGDFAIQALLTAAIHAAFPDDSFVGEEDATDLRTNIQLGDRVWETLKKFADVLPGSKEEMFEMIDWCGLGAPNGKKRVWVFDPIDGTKTFLRGEMYAINVALLEDGKQVLGVVACPLLSVDAKAPLGNDSLDPTGRGSILFGVKGHGAYVRPLPGGPDEVEVRRLEPHPENVTLGDLRLVSCSSSMVDSGIEEVHKAVAKKLAVQGPVSELVSWVARWASLAMGLTNMTVWVYRTRGRRAKIWDHAGAMLLFEEVGGKITDIDGKDIDLSVGRKATSNYGFVAAPKNIHATVLQAVQETTREMSGDLFASQ